MSPVQTAPVAAPATPQGRPMPTGSAPASPPQTPPVAPSAPAAPSAPQASATPSIPAGQPVTGNEAGTPPTTPEPAKRRGRKPQSEENRAYYPALNVDGDKNAQNKLKEVPTDFDPEKHLPLRSRDFEDTATFLDYKASRYEKEAAALRAEAKELRALGGKEMQAQKKKLEKLVASMAELRASMASGDIDVDAMLEQMRKKAEEKLAAQAATAQPAQ